MRCTGTASIQRCSPNKNNFSSSEQSSPLHKQATERFGRHILSSKILSSLSKVSEPQALNRSPKRKNKSNQIQPQPITSSVYSSTDPFSQFFNLNLSISKRSKNVPQEKKGLRKVSQCSEVSTTKRHLITTPKDPSPLFVNDHNNCKLERQSTFTGKLRHSNHDPNSTVEHANKMPMNGLTELKQPCCPKFSACIDAVRNSQNKSIRQPFSHEDSPCSKNSGRSFSPKAKTSSPNKKLFAQTVSSQSTNSSHGMSDRFKDRSPPRNPDNKNQPFRISEFMLGKEIGRGQYGSVYVAKHITTGFVCAIKRISKKFVKSKNIVNQMIREIKIQSCLDHPNIIKMYGVSQDQNNLYLIMELATSGQLYSLIKEKRKFSELKVAYILRQVCEAVRYLHAFKIIHRDIKPENIVIEHGTVKLCDFGWAVYKGHGLRSTFCGTPVYVSPEILKGEHYDEKIDIWSVGVLTFELLIGHIPFKIHSTEDLTKIVQDQITFPEDSQISETAKDFVLKFLQKNPGRRFNINQLLEHDFLKQCQDPSIHIEL